MATVTVDELLRQGRVEHVSADVRAAWRRVDEAKTHLESSAALAESDPTMAYVALYDGARKAISAHMQANGYRVTNRPSAHQATGLYGQAVVATAATLNHFRAFDRLRQIRNRSEYGQQPITQRLLTADAAHAKAIVAAVEMAMPPRRADG